MMLKARVLSTGKTAAGVEVPEALVTTLGSGRHPKVRVTVRGYTFRSSIGSMGGRFMLPMTADTRERAGVSPGDEVELDIEVDNEPRAVEVPPELAAGLAQDEAAARFFEGLSYSNQRRVVEPIHAAKAAETRARRIEKALAGLRAGRI